MDASAHCDMLRTSTHNRACLAYVVVDVMIRARHALSWLKFFPLRVRLVCPAFALLVGRTICFRGFSTLALRAFHRCGLSQLPVTLDKVAARGLRHGRFCLLPSGSWTVCLRLPMHAMCIEFRYSYTGNIARLPTAHSGSLQEVPLIARM